MKYFFGFILYALLTFGSFSSDKAEIAKILKQSTVYISIKKSDTLEEFGIGSGVVINRIKNKFYILTNSHVILFRDDNGDIVQPEEMGYDIWVHPHESIVSDNLGSFLITDYLYWDDEKGQDYAILMIDFDPWINEGFDFVPLEVTDDPNFYKSGKNINDVVVKKKLSTEDIPKMIPIKIGSSFELNELDTVYAAGYPMIAGNLTDHSKHIFITSGEINSFITEEEDLKYLNNYSIVYRLGVKGGMSGGPVVNSSGELIAINGLTETAYSLKEAAFKKTQKTSTFVPRVLSFFIGLLIDDSIDHVRDSNKQIYIPEKSVYDYGIMIEDIIAEALLDNEYNNNPNSTFYNYLPYSKIPESEKEFFNLLMEQNNIDKQ